MSKRPIRIFFYFVLISLLAGCTSEVKDCYTYDYSDCNTIEPQSGTMVIKLTINDENPNVIVQVFKGDFDSPDRVLMKTDTLDDELWRVDLPTGRFYSVAAWYKVNGKTLVAIDGDELKIKANVVCDSTCYEVKDGHADVKLRL